MKLNKKIKLFLAFGSGLMATTGIVTPLLCSCSNNNNDIGGLDKKYGVNDAMVKRLERQCAVNYRNTLTDKGITKPEIVNKKLEELNKDLSVLRDEAQKEKSSNSILSDSIVNLMLEQYDTKVAREFDPSINFEDEIQDFKNTCVNQITQKMNEEHIPSTAIQTKLDSFEQGFANIKSSLRGQYDDKLCVLNNLKFQSIALLDGINQQLDQKASEVTLKLLFDNFSFHLKEKDLENEYYWDNFTKTHKDNDDLTNFIENKFTCYNKKSKKDLENFKLDGTQTGGLINNYVIKPIYRGITSDIYRNVYAIKIEWQIIKHENLKRSEKDRTVYFNTAATNAFVKGKAQAEKVKNSSQLLQLSSDEKEYSVFALPITKSYEQEQLNKMFENITFVWDRSDEDASKGILYPHCKYEGFFGATKFEKGQILDINKLADIGLCITNTKDKTINRVDSILNKIKQNVETDEFDKLPVFEKILRSTDIYSFTKIQNDQNHDVANTIYVAYNNSKYVDPSHIGDDDHGGLIELCNADCIGMPISRELYESSKKDFDKAYQCLRTYDNDGKLSEFTSKVHQLSTILFLVSAGLAVLIFILSWIVCWYNQTAVPYYIGIIAYAALICICGAIWTRLVVKPTESFVKQIDDFKNSSQYKAFANKVNADYKNIYKTYDIFKNLPFESVIKPTVIYYKSLEVQTEYKNFEEKRKELELRGEDFKNKIQQNITITLATSFASETVGFITLCVIARLFIANADIQLVQRFVEAKHPEILFAVGITATIATIIYSFVKPAFH